jgi:hypothetical protein
MSNQINKPPFKIIWTVLYLSNFIYAGVAHYLLPDRSVQNNEIFYIIIVFALISLSASLFIFRLTKVNRIRKMAQTKLEEAENLKRKKEIIYSYLFTPYLISWVLLDFVNITGIVSRVMGLSLDYYNLFLIVPLVLMPFMFPREEKIIEELRLH